MTNNKDSGIEHAREFINRIRNDDEFRDRFQISVDPHKFVAEEGYIFSDEEFRDARTEMLATLTADDLRERAGWVMRPCKVGPPCLGGGGCA